MNPVLADAVDHELCRLRAVGREEHCRLIEVHVLLRDRLVFDDQVEVGVLALRVCLRKRTPSGPSCWNDFDLAMSNS